MEEKKIELSEKSTKPYPGNKFADFVAGLGIGIVYLIIAGFLSNNFFPKSFFNFRFNLFHYIAGILFLLITIKLFFGKQVYFALGFLSAILLPFLLFGACILAFRGF